MASLPQKPAQTLFRPCIDLHEGQVKQLVGLTLPSAENARAGKRSAADSVADASLRTNFTSSLPPVHYADIFQKCRLPLPGGHIIMLDGHHQTQVAHTPADSNSRSEEASLTHPTAQACASILAKYPATFHVGGGMTLARAKSWLDRGAHKLIFTSALFNDDQFSLPKLQELEKWIGKERIVIDLSSRSVPSPLASSSKHHHPHHHRNPHHNDTYQVMVKGWKKASDLFLTAETLETLSRYASEFLVHAVEREGMKGGIDKALLKLLAEHVRIPTVYAGGVHTVADIETIRSMGRGRIHFTVGSALALYGGTLTLEDILRYGEAATPLAR